MKSHIAPDVPYALYIWPYITGIKSTGGAFDLPTQQTINVHNMSACLSKPSNKGKSPCPRGVCPTIFLRRLHWSIGREGVIPDRRSQSHNLSGKCSLGQTEASGS